MDKITANLYATLVCAAFAILTFVLAAVYGWPQWREAVERRKAQRSAAVPVRTQRSAFVWWATATVFLLIACGIFAESWFYFGIKPYHPRLYWICMASVLLVLVALGWLIGNTADKILDDYRRARSDAETSKSALGLLRKADDAEIAHKDTFIADAQKEVRELKEKLNEKDKECEEKVNALNLQWSHKLSGVGDLPVEMEPTSGKADKQFLIVTNRGQKQQFYAQCDLLENSENLRTAFNLQWENGAKLSLATGESGKLLIARAWREAREKTENVALCGILQEVASSRWDVDDKADFHYLIRVRVFGESDNKYREQEYVLRPGRSAFFDMALASDGNNDTAITADDPRIYMDLRDDRNKDGSFQLSTPILLSNRGGSEAHNVSISEIKLRARTITFDKVIPVIPSDGTSEVEGNIGDDMSGTIRADIIRALMDEWNSYNSLKLEEIILPVTVTYSGFTGVKFQTRCDLVFNPFVEKFQNKQYRQKNPIEFRYSTESFRKVGLKNERQA